MSSRAAMIVTPISRHPTTLPAETIQTVLASPLLVVFRQHREHKSRPAKRVSIVVMTLNNLVHTRLSLAASAAVT